jgi:hypothetical protein
MIGSVGNESRDQAGRDERERDDDPDRRPLPGEIIRVTRQRPPQRGKYASNRTSERCKKGA